LHIDWGFFDIAIPDAESSETTISIRPWESFVSSGKLNSADTMEGPPPANRFAPQLAVSLAFGSVGSAPVIENGLLLTLSKT
jgi:hypothetical protein